MRWDTSFIVISSLMVILGMSLSVIFYYFFKFTKFVKEDNLRRGLEAEVSRLEAIADEREKIEELNKVMESIVEYQEANREHKYSNVINMSDYQRKD